jgi:predicted nuclease of predicted toxin-antitoxin system
MRFLLDMGLPRRTARFLCERGHDAVHLREQGLQRMTDVEIIAKARTEQRVILTHDLDFGRIMALSKSSLPSVITFRLSDMRPDQVNRYLQRVLNRFGDELSAGALVSVGERAIRVRALPVESNGLVEP